MKKTILITVLVVITVAALGVGVASAQGSQPPVSRGYGWMHEYIEQALASKLGLTEEQIEEQFAAGKSMYQIALDSGIAESDVTEFLTEVHQEAFAKAVEAGVITQEQADWMLQRMQNRGYGYGNCPMHNNGQSVPGSGRGFGPGYGPGMMQGGGGRGPMWGQSVPAN